MKMKIFRYVLMILAVVLFIYNVTKLNKDALFEGESKVAIIGMLAAACVLVLLIILELSFKIKKSIKK